MIESQPIIVYKTSAWHKRRN